MGYFSDGFFTGMLASVRETGRKFKNGAKELVEDFISGFNGHGWKLWKRGDSWRLELDELLVRKSFQVFELIINQITAIKGSQAITQGHAKIKDVAVIESADVYREKNIEIYNENFTDSKWTLVSDHYLDYVNPETTIITFENNKIIIDATNTLSGRSCIFIAKEQGVSSIKVYAEIESEYSEPIVYNPSKTHFPLNVGSGIYEIPAFEAQPLGGVYFNIAPTTKAIITLIPSSVEYETEIVQEPCYRIQIDDELNSIIEYDLVRCQKGDKFYYVQVGSVFQYYINIPVSEFDTNEEGVVMNPPQSGDEIVQFGNVSHQETYANRHSAIYLHVDEDEPAIDLMTDIYTKDWSEGNILKTRIGGNLPGTDGDRGFYCVNGKLLFVDENGDTVSVINPDGSASFARGKLSWSKDGSPSFSGTILLNVDSNNVWEVTSDCTNIIGDKNGQRIEISASDRKITFFNYENKNSLMIEAVNRDNINELFNEEEVKIVILTLPINVGAGSVKERDLTSKFKIEKVTTLEYTMKATAAQGSSLDVSYVRLYLNKYDNLVTEKPSMKTIIWEGVYDKTTNIDITNTIVFSNIGLYGLSIYCVSDKGFNAFGVQNLSISTVIDGYISSFFANGIGLGTSNKNAFFVADTAFDEGNFVNAFISNKNSGLEISKDNIYTKRSGFWGLMPSIICTGRAHTNTTAAYIDLCASFDGQIPTIARHGVGDCSITFPNDWALYDINKDTCIILLTGTGLKHGEITTNNVISPSVRLFENSNLIRITLKSNNAVADGTFYFEIKRIV